LQLKKLGDEINENSQLWADLISLTRILFLVGIIIIVIGMFLILDSSWVFNSYLPVDSAGILGRQQFLLFTGIGVLIVGTWAIRRGLK